MSVSLRKQRWNRKRKISNDDGPRDLETKVMESGGEAYYGLELPATGNKNNDYCRPPRSESGIYGSRQSVASRSGMSLRSRRSFRGGRGEKKTAASKKNSRSRRPSTGQTFRSASSQHAYSRSSGRLKRSSTTTRTESSVRSGRTISSAHTGTDTIDKAAVHIVCAIGENLARETCVASLDAGAPICLQVTKQGNGQTYAETIAYLEMLQPHEVLLNEGRRNSHLAKKVLQLFSSTPYNGSNNHDIDELAPSNAQGNDVRRESDERWLRGPCKTSTVVKFISRSCFDQTKGASLLRRLARKENYDAALVEEYILLSASHAVLNYTQHALGVSFSRNCLDIHVNSGGKNRMAIDRATIMQLELLINAKTGRTQNTLISTIDCTKTTVGSRLLRTNILSPPCRVDTINARLDLVDTFLEDEEFFYSVLEHLQSLPAVDKMLTNVAIVPRKFEKVRSNTGVLNSPSTARLASKGISALVCIKSTLTALPGLVRILMDHAEYLEETQERDKANVSLGTENRASDDNLSANTTGRSSSLLIGLGGGVRCPDNLQRHQLLRAIISALSQPSLEEIRDRVADVFTPSTNFSRNANAMRHQECFALKSAENGMMDILRKAFLANVDDIYEKADKYAEVHGMHVSVKYSTSRGYYLSVPAELASQLPNLFIQPAKCGKFIHCTTEEVHSLNIRAQDNVQDLLLMTHDRIQEVLDFARSRYDALAALSDAIALLDVCHSFADNVTLSKMPWSRPIVTEKNGTPATESAVLAIRNGRYGIGVDASYLASAEGPQELIPNDTYANDSQFFTLITGINGSGKSTYLKQIAIIILLAHCGSYVPAEHASVPLRSRLCARMGTSDDQENNISSFMLEMNETAFLCNNATEGSLIMIDELGRATGNRDGMAIAWAVSEHLLSKKAMTFFVTHYPSLCKLGEMYTFVQNLHLEASVPRNHDGQIQYSHKIGPGPCNVTPNYGIDMAASCGWPRDVVLDAREIESKLEVLLGNNSCLYFGGERQKETNHQGSPLCAQNEMSQQSICQQINEVIQSDSSTDALRTSLQVRSSKIDELLPKDTSDKGPAPGEVERNQQQTFAEEEAGQQRSDNTLCHDDCSENRFVRNCEPQRPQSTSRRDSAKPPSFEFDPPEDHSGTNKSDDGSVVSSSLCSSSCEDGSSSDSSSSLSSSSQSLSSE